MSAAAWHRRLNLIARRELCNANADGALRMHESFTAEAAAINAELRTETPDGGAA